jgi:hypothetical protein
MAQIANRDDARNANENTKDHAKEAVDKGAEAAKNATQRTADVGRQAAERGTETVQRFLAGASRAADTTVKVEQDFARLWVELAGEQFRHQTETVQRLMQARDWREIAEIQGSFVRESMSRMAHAVNYQFELGNAVTTRMLSLGREQARKAA